MNLHGRNLIGKRQSGLGSTVFRAQSPISRQQLPTDFFEATPGEVNSAAELAFQAFLTYRKVPPQKKALFLRNIADEIMHLGDDLIDRCNQETGLPQARLTGERTRTVNQLRMFAKLVEEGSWVDARIDKTASGKDIRRMLIPMGPVAVFGASNFPLAFSVAGGDTASALAAGCPVIFKAHPLHPGTCEMVGRAILRAIDTSGMPEGTFSLLHGESFTPGIQLVRHPNIQAVAFTGSLAGGTALFREAVQRDVPIPVFAEMGSINPMFFLPGAVMKNSLAIAEGLAASITLGVGQFCTNPGVFFIQAESAESFLSALREKITQVKPGIMLSHRIAAFYHAGVKNQLSIPGVDIAAGSISSQSDFSASPIILKTTADVFLKNPVLSDEVFGPASLAVLTRNQAEILDIARTLKGQLTATIHATSDDMPLVSELLPILEMKAGRVIFNDFPTGVEVCNAMHHGGPAPATTDVRFTSVGTAAILRFVRPVCYQGCIHAMLPLELADDNPLQIRRYINGKPA